MSHNEYRLFGKYAAACKTVLEFGSGGSTIHFIKKRKQIYSVESNPAYFAFLNEIKMVKRYDNLVYTFVDIGPTNDWGEPLCRERQAHWPLYYTAIWDHIQAQRSEVDLVFIDGRFRVCCALYCILQLKPKNWKGLIMIHDFWNRPEYHVLLDYLSPVEQVRSLAVFRLKDNLPTDAIPSLLNDYASAYL